MSPIRILIVACLMLFLSPSSGFAQKRHEHYFFWLSFGPGAGINLSQGSDEAGGLGGAGYIRVGGAFTQQILIGVEFLAWVRPLESDSEGDPPTIQRTNPSIVLMYYPSDMGGLFLKAGVSGAYVDIKDGDRWVAERGSGARAGIGYDVRLSKNLFLTPNLDWMFQTIEPTTGAKTTSHMLMATLGLTWH